MDDPKTLARASQVSKRWHDLLSDDLTWKLLCDKHAYRRLSENNPDDLKPFLDPVPLPTQVRPLPFAHQVPRLHSPPAVSGASPHGLEPAFSDMAGDLARTTKSFDSATSALAIRRRPKALSYKSHFKQRYMVETAWRSGGRAICRHITPDQGVVTSLHLTSKYIIVALDNAKIHVFNTDGEHQRTLNGHVMGVWAMVPWGDILVSGGCDRDVRVWNMATG